MPESFSEIIGLWELPSQLASEIGAKANTVSKWGQRDFIPPEWWTAIERAAKSRGFAGVTVRRMAELAGRAKVA